MFRPAAVVFAILFCGLLLSAVQASTSPLNLSGNLGYNYALYVTEEAKRSQSSYVVGSLNADSYLWQPWFATFNVGGSGTGAFSLVEEGVEKRSLLLSSRSDFRFLPRSRAPMVASFYMQNNLDPATSDSVVKFPGKDLLRLGLDIKTRFFGVKQSFIGRSGDQLDLWIQDRARQTSSTIGDSSEQTYGGKIQSRVANHNFYATGSYQTREGGITPGSKTQAGYLTAMHHYVPNSEFYIKTLGSHINYTDKSGTNDSSSEVSQASSFFYWRPVYRPYVLNGALRVNLRQFTNNNDSLINDTQGVNAFLSGTYTINRRTQLTASVSGNALDTESRQNISSKQNVQLMYQSDQVIRRGFQYRWFSNAGIGNDAGSERSKIGASTDFDLDLSQNLNAGLGHSISRHWITGNRSSLRTSFTQQAREYLVTKDLGSILTVSHSGSFAWNLDVNTGGAYAQLTAMDTRSFFDNSLEMQIINMQISRSMPITRLSAWSGNFSLQSSRRDEGGSDAKFFDEFLTVATGRLSYQHSRLFGIYKLKFRTKFDLSSTINKSGEDRLQGDWENQLGYNIGKLATSLVGRGVISNSGLGSISLIFQINRNF